MITVFGEGRGFRVVWLLEEMGLPYRLRPVDLIAGVEDDTEVLAINPAGFIPAIQDGDVTMVESIARGRTGLCGSNHRTRILQASHGDMSVHQSNQQVSSTPTGYTPDTKSALPD